jgi:hypothetical protein
MKPGDKFIAIKGVLSGSVWEITHSTNYFLHDSICIIGNEYYRKGLKDCWTFRPHVWEPYHDKSSNFKDIHDILNNSQDNT